MLTVIVVLAILWLTLVPKPLGEKEISLFPGADKVVHALMFGGLTFVALVDWARGRNYCSVRPAVCIVTALASTLLGVAIEYIQRAMALGRDFDVMDMAADACGAFIVALIWIAAEYHRNHRHGTR